MAEIEKLRKMKQEVETIVEEGYSELKDRFECRRCKKKISSNFDLLISLRFIPIEDGILCSDCLKKYIYELEKPENKK